MYSEIIISICYILRNTVLFTNSNRFVIDSENICLIYLRDTNIIDSLKMLSKRNFAILLQNISTSIPCLVTNNNTYTHFVKLQIKVDKFESSHHYAPILHIQVIQNITHANNTKYC